MKKRHGVIGRMTKLLGEHCARLEAEGKCPSEALFEQFDADGNGLISQHEFCDALKSIDGADFTRADVAALIKHFDLNRDASVDYDEFVNMLRGGLEGKRGDGGGGGGGGGGDGKVADEDHDFMSK